MILSLDLQGDLKGDCATDIFVIVQRHFNHYSKPLKMIMNKLTRNSMDIQSIRTKNSQYTFKLVGGNPICTYQDIPISINADILDGVILMEYL